MLRHCIHLGRCIARGNLPKNLIFVSLSGYIHGQYRGISNIHLYIDHYVLETADVAGWEKISDLQSTALASKF